MALTCNQIITLATQIAKTPNYTSQAQQLLNLILTDLAETYDFDIQKVTSFTVVTGASAVNFFQPYNLPTNYLRASPGEVDYVVSGQPFILTQIDMARIRALFQAQGVSDYPYNFATDFSTVQTLGFPQAYLWPPPNGAYSILWPYFKAHTDITDFTQSPWFPNSQYLVTRLAGELMRLSDDTRQKAFADEAENMLRKYLQMKDDPEGYAQQVKLDRMSFRSYANLPATKATVF